MTLDSALKSDARKQIGQRRHYNKATRLKNHDTPGNVVCGRMLSLTCSRTRGFSARNHKSTATVSGVAIGWAGVARRRAGQEAI